MVFVPLKTGTIRTNTIALQNAADFYAKYIGDARQSVQDLTALPITDYADRNSAIVKLNREICNHTIDFARDLLVFNERYPTAFASTIKKLRDIVGNLEIVTNANANMYREIPVAQNLLVELKDDHKRVLTYFYTGSEQLADLLTVTTKAIAATAAIDIADLAAAAIEAYTPAAESSSIPAAIEAANIAAAAAIEASTPAAIEAAKIAAAAAESSSVSVPEGSWSTITGWVSADPIAAGLVVFAVVAITVVTVKLVYDWYTAPVADLPLATKAAVDDISSSAADNLPIKAGFDPFEGSFSEGVFGPFGLPLFILFAGVFYGSIVSPNLCKLYALDAMSLTKAFRVACQFFKLSFKKN